MFISDFMILFPWNIKSQIKQTKKLKTKTNIINIIIS